MKLKPASDNIYSIIFLKELLAVKNRSYFKYGIFLINICYSPAGRSVLYYCNLYLSTQTYSSVVRVKISVQ